MKQACGISPYFSHKICGELIKGQYQTYIRKTITENNTTIYVVSEVTTLITGGNNDR